jgi:carbamoyltransferase
MILWGWAGMSHDASLAVYKDNEIVYASHSERYSRNKNEKQIHLFTIDFSLMI